VPIVPLDFGTQSNPGRYGPDTGPRFINAFVEAADAKGKAVFPFYPVYGLSSFATLTGGTKSRGAISFGSYGYVVSGPLLFKVDSGGAVTTVGGIPNSAPVFMARNRKSPNAQIAIVTDGLRFIVENDVISTIADADLPAPNSVTAIAGYFVFTISDGRFFITEIDEGTDIDALDFSTAEANPDGLSVGYARGGEVILAGPKSIEFWAHTGAAAFPFERIPGSTLQSLGILCKYSMRDLNDVVMFVASDGTVRMLDGYTPRRISTHAQERDIDAVTDKDSITATAYTIRGHGFYKISCEDWTWVYNATTGFWHEEASYGLNRWRGEVFVDINGVRVVGDHENGLMYRINPDAYDEAGEHLVMTVRSAPFHTYPSPLAFNTLYVDTIPGVGLNTTDDHEEDPLIMMRFSDDSGRTWSDEMTAPVGKIGEFSKRVTFSQLGQSLEDGRIFELSMSAAVIRGITSIAADVEKLEP
jgi:hypothetical protein